MCSTSQYLSTHEYNCKSPRGLTEINFVRSRMLSSILVACCPTFSCMSPWLQTTQDGCLWLLKYAAASWKIIADELTQLFVSDDSLHVSRCLLKKSPVDPAAPQPTPLRNRTIVCLVLTSRCKSTRENILQECRAIIIWSVVVWNRTASAEIVSNVFQLKGYVSWRNDPAVTHLFVHVTKLTLRI